MLRIILPRRIFCFAALAAIFVAQVSAADSSRKNLSLNQNWKFHLGDNWPNASNLSHLGTSRGPITERFNDSAWRSLDLPHDWAIELPFDRTADGGHEFKPCAPQPFMP